MQKECSSPSQHKPAKSLNANHKMVEENIPAFTRFDDPLVPVKAHLPYGKCNLLLDLQKLQKNHIFRIFWFPLNVDLLREALEITPVDPAHPFVSPSAGEQVMDFVNELGYLEVAHFVSKMHVNNLYQSWRAMLTLINQCLTGKTSGSDKPRHPGIQTFFSHQASLSITSKKSTPHVIPYCQFKKLIIYYLGSRHNIHRWPESLVHVTSDDFPFGNLKFVPKGEKDEVFGKPIPKDKKVRKGKSSLQLVDEDEEAQPEPEPQVEDEEYDLQRGIQMSLESFPTHKQAPVGGVAIRELVLETTQKLYVVKGKGKSIATDEQRAPVIEEASTRPLTQPEDDTSANVVRNTPSLVDAETGADTDRTNSEEKLNWMKTRLDQTLVIRSSLDLPQDEDHAGSNPGQSHVALAGPNPELMYEDFVATVYPQVHESLKHPDEEHVHLENPLSSSGTLSSMKNFDDAFTYGDQFHNDKPNKEEPDKANVEIEVESMVTVPIHQASSSTPPLSTPIIIISSPKLVSPPIQEPVFTAITKTTTTTLPPPPPPQQQSTIDCALAARVTTLEQICANFEKKNKVQDQTAQALSSRIFTLENHDLYSKFEKYINENVKEVVQDALQAPVPLEASMDRKNKEEFMDAMDKSRKRRRDDHDPPPPPLKDSDKKAPSSSSKKNPNSLFQQPIDDIPIPDDMHLLDLEDTGADHLPKIKTREDWLKPIPEEERPETPEPNWVIPPNDLPESENNWVNAFAKSYQDPEENKILQKTSDMGSFIKSYCRQIGKSKLSKADLEGPDQIDLVNPEGNRIVPDVSKPLPLGGSKERRNALSISELKAAYYPDFRLEELVPSLYSAPFNRRAVRSHMKILSVVSLKTYSRYGYTYLKEIVLRRADYNEYKISKSNFKNLHPNDSEDMYLLHLQEDYTIVSKPRSVIYKDRNNQKKMMRETKVHKFSDDTLTRILEKLDHMVKDFRLFKYKPGIKIESGLRMIKG
ncbi:hypothetical protein Tco_0968642 [Tanacetum coccineum]